MANKATEWLDEMGLSMFRGPYIEAVAGLANLVHWITPSSSATELR